MTEIACGHPECREISKRLEVISKEQGYEVWERALYVLGYCAPRHEDESEYDLPEDAMDFIDPKTMPHTVEFVRHRRQVVEEDERQAQYEADLAEIREEMRQHEFCEMSDRLERWEELTEISLQRLRTDKENHEIADMEKWFGGRAAIFVELLKYRAWRTNHKAKT